ncbi:ClpP/crotonase [Sistotremastrum niveocremeum HHB9708]|uniref:ClpP/crotonase n=1 Tax=Sistotremastrum niveocremeum HHB9708 TaxID=1314777 RepID=A0A164SUX9_9AGAM|nr:ClpP/crotonase [Sistotremastrum niveocremeum HHB9708]
MASYSPKYFKISFASEGVLLVEINRPPANAFSEEAWEELGATFQKIGEDGSVRVVVLASTNPRIWSGGIDLASFATMTKDSTGSLDPARHALYSKKYLTRFQAAISAVENCLHPVIAAVNGAAPGLSIDIMTAADIRYASSDTRFSVKACHLSYLSEWCLTGLQETLLGMAADIGTLARFPKVVGNQSLARELAFTGRNFTAEEALSIGLVSKIVPGTRDDVIKAALETAKQIAKNSPIAVAGTKHLMLHARDHSVQENLDYTATWNAAMLMGPDTSIAYKGSRKGGPPPVFPPLEKLSGKL